MANLRQDRVPDQTLSPSSAPGSGGALAQEQVTPARPIIVSIRLWTEERKRTPANIASGATPAVALVLDLVKISGGEVKAPDGSALSARFPDVASALLTVRRIQWGIEGLTENASFRSTAATIVVHSLSDPVHGAEARALDDAAQGQLLLSESIAAVAQQLPSALVRETTLGSWRELLWNHAAPPPGYAADEQEMVRLIGELGHKDPWPALAVSPPAQTPVAATRIQAQTEQETRVVVPTAPPAPARPEPPTLGRRVADEEDAPSADEKKKWLIYGGAAAAVLLIAAVVLFAFVSSKAGKPPAAAVPAPPPATDAGTPAVSVATPVSPRRGATEPAAKEPLQHSRQTDAEKKVSGPTPIASPEWRPRGEKAKTNAKGNVPSTPCELTDAEIPLTLARAESLMHGGRLEEARAKLQTLQGCTAARQQAYKDLEWVRQRMPADEPPPE